MPAPMWKDPKGTATKARRARSRKAHAAESAIMQESVRLQGGVCRWPGCDCRRRGLRIDPAHQRDRHRGIGGNPAGDRTTLDTIMAFCRERHRQYDASQIDYEARTDKGTLGPCDFFVLKDGQRVLVGRERLMGVLAVDHGEPGR